MHVPGVPRNAGWIAHNCFALCTAIGHRGRLVALGVFALGPNASF
jgi:hypothetical protein